MPLPFRVETRKPFETIAAGPRGRHEEVAKGCPRANGKKQVCAIRTPVVEDPTAGFPNRLFRATGDVTFQDLDRSITSSREGNFAAVG